MPLCVAAVSDMRTAHVIRWVLIPVAVCGAWLAAIGIGVAIFSALESLCPESQMVSGMCIAPWRPSVDEVSFAFSAAVAAVNVVLAASLTAPRARRRVASITYAIGLLVAIAFALVISDPYPLAAAAAAGALAVRWIRRRPTRPSP